MKDFSDFLTPGPKLVTELLESAIIKRLVKEKRGQGYGKDYKPFLTLSTLFFRANDSQDTLGKILDELMTSHSPPRRDAMSWKPKENAETLARAYLDHPEKKIKSEADALEAWVAKAAQKIMSL